ncbi:MULTISPECIES: hypothetical protein [unclassified Halomonas]|uniref:tetratricopeptide repeat protein n=1 Tax=unclassified Halomonas TaxID=2609666 RepID=UPI002076943B|nr:MULTISPECIES: hypothetical protein [unclassified Halomonas]
MKQVPLRADQPIVQSLQEKRFANVPVSDIEMQSFLRQAKAISSNSLEGVFATAYVYGFWRKFSQAEDHADKLVAGWPSTPQAFYYATVCYGISCCYEKGLKAAQRLCELEPGRPRGANMLSYISLLSGAISEYARARQIMKRIGVPEAEIPSIENMRESDFLTQNGIDQSDVVRYYQLHLNVAKPFLEGKQNMHLGSDVHLCTDPEDGSQEFWINLVTSTDGITASKIDWEFSKQDFDGFSDNFKEKVWVGISLAPDDGVEPRRIQV